MYIETFGAKLKRARINAGYTQQQLAAETKIKQSQISKFENGIQEPRIEQIGILADFLAVSTDWLIGTEGENRKQTQ